MRKKGGVPRDAPESGQEAEEAEPNRKNEEKKYRGTHRGRQGVFSTTNMRGHLGGGCSQQGTGDPKGHRQKKLKV